jgi:hypothetical protein
MRPPLSIIICCYGIYDPELRQAKEMIGLEEYLDACLATVIRLSRSFDITEIIFSGGYTNPESDKSEAASMARQFQQRLNANMLSRLIIRVEERSGNTPQNIVYSTQLVGQTGLFALICDHHRGVRVWIIWFLLKLRKYLGSSQLYQVFPLERTDIHPHSNWWRQLYRGLQYCWNFKLLKEELERLPKELPEDS